MWRVLSFKTIISQNLKDTPLSLSVHPQLSVIPHAQQAVSDCFNGLALSDPLTFLFGVDSVLSVLSRLEDKDKVMPLYEHLLNVIDDYERMFDFYKAEALGMVALCVEELQPSKEVKMLECRIKSAISLLEHALFKDYVRVQLISSLLQHKSYAEVASEMDLIEHPICKVWAQVHIIGHTSNDREKLPLTVIKGFEENRSKDDLSSTHPLIQLGKKIVELAAKPVSEPTSIGVDIHKGDRVGYLHISVLALADIVSALNKVGVTSRLDEEILGELLCKSIRVLSLMKLKWEWFSYEVMEVLLKQTQQIVHLDIRQQVFAEMLGHVTYIDPLYRLEFLRNLAEAMQQADDKESLAKLAQVLPNLPGQDVCLDEVGKILFIARTAISPMQSLKVMDHFIDQIAKSETLRKDPACIELIRSICDVLDAISATKLLKRLRDIYAGAEQFLYLNVSEAAHIAIADCYAKLDLWEEAKHYGEDPQNVHKTAVLSHLGFYLDGKKRIMEGRKFFIEAFKARKDFYQQEFMDRARSSLAAGFARRGSFGRALKELRNIRETSHIANTLIRVCNEVEKSLQGSLEFETERLLINEALGKLSGSHKWLGGLGAKARFLMKRGYDEEAKETLGELLISVNRKIKDAQDSIDLYLDLATVGLGNLLMEVDDDQGLRSWLDVVSILCDRFKDWFIVDLITESIKPRIAKEKPWVISKLIDILSRDESGRDSAKALCRIAMVIRRYNRKLWMDG
jgi:hypothetical protein